MGHQTETDGRPWDTDLVPSPPGRSPRPDPDCPVEIALAAVSGRWTTLVLRELMHSPHSFGALRERLPDLSPKVLTDRLHTLVERGLVTQQRLPGFPVRTRYTLTATGRALRPLLVELYRTGEALRDGAGGAGRAEAPALNG
ncbi:helix-turn-helix transcriptional regulator [Streptomyces sp. NBC_00249]|uniref:winged helix-turn-helix transcriptional regulator n=1 Tax=Streptomyces sp. NBC_00249 TaxID=2975690 RepID=UPI00225AC3E7|nr:helix-turn-helix domain-containing protein [Streptomyces sp. NBC_00249]MCX5192539.1 helix-turn-helix transcriptional regulator [Streptomyces sp. NBC_00249]